MDNHIAGIEIHYGDGRPLRLNVAGPDERVAKISGFLHTIGDPIGDVVRVSDSPGAYLRAINQKGVPAISPLPDARHYSIIITHSGRHI